MNKQLKHFYLILSISLISLTVIAQAPQSIPYQAVARDIGGNLISGQTISLRFSIKNLTASGNTIYQETHIVNTNEFGLFNVNVGQGNVLSGSFNAIPWGIGSKFLQVELDVSGGSNYVNMGTQQLMSVPYALFAETTNNPSVTATYRWATFHTYDQSTGWSLGNNPNLFGGVPPSSWTDASATAGSMSSDKEVLRTLFTNKGYAKGNAVIMNENWQSFSSTNGKVVMALFRIKNTTAASITWSPSFYYSAYSAWGEFSSVALNGNSVFTAGSSGNTSLSLSIPPNRVSTIIFVSTSSNDSPLRNCRLAFINNSLILPSGLIYVDDLDTATGGYEQ